MKLRNKKTRELGYFCFANWDSPTIIIMDKNGIQLAKYNSLVELNKEWEDVPEEPKEWYWFIEDNGIIQRSCHYEDLHPTLDKSRKEIGNYFDTKEEAEKAVEKLKAWKRLKDNGIYFSLDTMGKEHTPYIKLHSKEERGTFEKVKTICKDLDLLFGGEE